MAKDKVVKVADAQAAIDYAVKAGKADMSVLSGCCVTIMQGGVPVRICWC